MPHSFGVDTCNDPVLLLFGKYGKDHLIFRIIYIYERRTPKISVMNAQNTVLLEQHQNFDASGVSR